MSGHGDPPNAASRIAATPQVGGSSHEIGRTQSGSSVERDEEAADQPDRATPAPVPSAQAPR